MIAALRAWFNERSRRERWMLIAMAGLLVVTILWIGIILPVTDGLASARQRHDDAVLRLADTKARVDAEKALAAEHPAPISGALADYIRQSAGNAGFALTNVNPQGDDRVDITVGTAKTAALFSWIADLEDAGVVVDSIDITNNNDQTVQARMTLMKRGA